MVGHFHCFLPQKVLPKLWSWIYNMEGGDEQQHIIPDIICQMSPQEINVSYFLTSGAAGGKQTNLYRTSPFSAAIGWKMPN